MLRRRPATVPPPAPAAPSGPSPLVERLRADGWVLPRGLQPRTDGEDPAWTLVGTVASPTATPVDGAGLVVAEGWSLDWWIGADDRWHQPSIEPTVRQGIVGDAPVVETRLRIPGGDAVHRAYGVRSPRLGGDEWVVVEIENATPVPFAAALVVRPLLADRPGAVGSISVVPTFGGAGRDEAHLVRLDGRASLVLPRRPNRSAVGTLADGDLTVEALEGAGEEPASVACADGFATAALVYPVPHTAVLRVLVPVGQQDPAALIGWPSAVPEVPAVASGWDVQVRGPRVALPERRLADAFDRAARQVLLAHDGTAVHRDGRGAPDLDPGATELLLGALDVLDRPTDSGPVIVGWEDRLAAPSPEVDATVLRSVSRHHRLHRIGTLLDWILPDVAAAVEAHRTGGPAGTAGRSARPPSGGPGARRRRRAPAVGRPDRRGRRGRRGRRRARRRRPGARRRGRSPRRPRAEAGARRSRRRSRAGGARGRGVAHRRLAGPRWSRPPDRSRPRGIGRAGPGGPRPARGRRRRRAGAGAGPAADLVRRGHRAARRADRGRDAVVRRALARPPSGAALGPRRDRLGPVRLTAPGLDPSWSTTVAKGEALLGEVAPPEGSTSTAQCPTTPTSTR
ncbi:MAG: hypothetical protein R2711_18180 [Acidimicrobiales bacterium]